MPEIRTVFLDRLDADASVAPPRTASGSPSSSRLGLDADSAGNPARTSGMRY
jgi:hypothetical protein